MNSPIKLIVGLGNPGREYAQTRHNVGFMVLDHLAARWSTQFSSAPKWNALKARAGNIHLLKPTTFMNESGRAVTACAQFHKITPEQILVIYDEAALPLGKLRLKPTGSAGGHNGMKSIIACLASPNFARLRVGIGAPGRKDLVGHVLGKFLPEEKEALDKSLARAAEAVIFATLHGWAAAMNQFNTDEPAATPGRSQPQPNKALEGPKQTINQENPDTKNEAQV